MSVFGVERHTRDKSSGFGASIRPGYTATVIRFAGALDLASGPEIQATLECALDVGASIIVIDLSRATFIDAHGIGLIIGARRSAIERGAALGVSGVNGEVARVFELAGLGELVQTVVRAEGLKGDADGHR